MKAEILQRLRQQQSAAGAAAGTQPSADTLKDASDIDLSRQYLDDLESRSVSTFPKIVIYWSSAVYGTRMMRNPRIPAKHRHGCL